MLACEPRPRIGCVPAVPCSRYSPTRYFCGFVSSLGIRGSSLIRDRYHSSRCICGAAVVPLLRRLPSGVNCRQQGEETRLITPASTYDVPKVVRRGQSRWRLARTQSSIHHSEIHPRFIGVFSEDHVQYLNCPASFPVPLEGVPRQRESFRACTSHQGSQATKSNSTLPRALEQY